MCGLLGNCSISRRRFLAFPHYCSLIDTLSVGSIILASVNHVYGLGYKLWKEMFCFLFFRTDGLRKKHQVDERGIMVAKWVSEIKLN